MEFYGMNKKNSAHINDSELCKCVEELYTIIVTHNNYKLANYKCNIISFYDYCILSGNKYISGYTALVENNIPDSTIDFLFARSLINKDDVYIFFEMALNKDIDDHKLYRIFKNLNLNAFENAYVRYNNTYMNIIDVLNYRGNKNRVIFNRLSGLNLIRPNELEHLNESEQHDVEQEQQAVEPEQPAAEPEQPAVEPEQPAVEPEQPAVEPEQPAVEPEQ